MNSPGAVLRLILFASAFVAPVIGFAAEPLRYKFAADSTNAYRLTVESPSEANPLKLEGVIVVEVRSAEEDGATLSMRGRLQPVREEGARGPGRAMPRFGPFGPAGPGGGFAPQSPWATLPMMAMPMSAMNAMNEVRVDSRGRILRVAGLLELPDPIENFAAILFQTLPEGPVEWTDESTVAVDEDASNRPRMGGFMPSRMGARGARLTGVRKESARVTHPEERTARLQNEMEFRSFLNTGTEPRMAFSKKGEFVFDRDRGTMQSGKIEGLSVITTMNFSQRAPVKVSFERLEGDDLAKALTEGGHDQPEEVTEPELETLLAQLKGNDPEKRAEAARRLMTSGAEKYAGELLAVALPFATDNDPALRTFAAQVLGEAATHEEVPLLLRLLKLGDHGQEHHAMKALQRLKDKRTIEPLADYIARGGNASHMAARILGEIGPAAEDAGLELLKEKHHQTRVHACQILQNAGTKKSLEPLQAAIGEGNQNLINQAGAALQSIRLRSEEAAKLVL